MNSTATTTHTCDCKVCQGITFTAPVGYIENLGTPKVIRDAVHNYAQMFRSPMLRVLAERRGMREVVR